MLTSQKENLLLKLYFVKCFCFKVTCLHLKPTFISQTFIPKFSLITFLEAEISFWHPAVHCFLNTHSVISSSTFSSVTALASDSLAARQTIIKLSPDLKDIRFFKRVKYNQWHMKSQRTKQTFQWKGENLLFMGTHSARSHYHLLVTECSEWQNSPNWRLVMINTLPVNLAIPWGLKAVKGWHSKAYQAIHFYWRQKSRKRTLLVP